MADVIEWNGATGENRSKDGIRNLRLSTGNTYELRFVGSPVRFYKYFVAGKFAIVAHPTNNPIKQKWNLDPQTRYAANVLLRNDVGEYKGGENYLLEFPQSIYNDICDWGKARKTDPGGKGGCNFSVTVTGSGKKTRYKTVGLDIAPFTEAEKEYLRANVYDLTKLFKPTPDEEVVQRLQMSDGPPAESRQPSVPTGGGADLPF
jgi:hypothetical protein